MLQKGARHKILQMAAAQFIVMQLVVSEYLNRVSTEKKLDFSLFGPVFYSSTGGGRGPSTK